MSIRLSDGRVIPMEMHKVRIVQKTTLPPISDRLTAIADAGYNTFLLPTRDIFLDMLTDSGTNAMSDNQLGAMMVSDDAYAGSESFTRLAAAVKEVMGFDWTMPVHQGRVAEHLLAKVFVKPGSVVIMNYHFTTSRAHVELAGGTVLELISDEGLKTTSSNLFKGNMDLDKLRAAIAEHGRQNRLYPHGSDHEPGGRSALLAGQSARGQGDRQRPQHPVGLRRQPDLRKCLSDQGARGGLSRLVHRRHHPRADEVRGHHVSLGPQEHRGARRSDRHQQSGLLRPPAKLAAGVRGLCDLRRHVHQGNRGDDRRPARDVRDRCGRQRDAVHQVFRRSTGRQRRAGRDPGRRPGLPSRRQAFPAAHRPAGISRPAHWPPRSTSPPASAAWSAAPSRPTATCRATR